MDSSQVQAHRNIRRGDVVRVNIGRGLVGMVELIEAGRVSVRINAAWRHFCDVADVELFADYQRRKGAGLVARSCGVSS